MVDLTKRSMLIGIGSVATGSIATTLVSQPAQAVDIDVQTYSVDSQKKTVNNPVERVDLSVSGDLSIDSNTEITRLVLRLEATRTSEYTQLTAKSYNPNSKTYSTDFTLNGNLMDLPNVGHDDVSPTERGETKEITLDSRITVQAYSDGTQVDSVTVTDTFPVKVQKEKGKVTVGIDATGSVSVVT